MADEDKPKCPHCGSTGRQRQYNKWHVREIYCTSCWRCLNSRHVRRQTRMAEVAFREGKIDEFHEETYTPSPELLQELEAMDQEEEFDKPPSFTEE